MLFTSFVLSLLGASAVCASPPTECLSPSTPADKDGYIACCNGWDGDTIDKGSINQVEFQYSCKKGIASSGSGTDFEKAATPRACAEACLNHSDCVASMWRSTSKRCFMFTDKNYELSPKNAGWMVLEKTGTILPKDKPADCSENVQEVTAQCKEEEAKTCQAQIDNLQTALKQQCGREKDAARNEAREQCEDAADEMCEKNIAAVESKCEDARKKAEEDNRSTKAAHEDEKSRWINERIAREKEAQEAKLKLEKERSDAVSQSRTCESNLGECQKSASIAQGDWNALSTCPQDDGKEKTFNGRSYRFYCFRGGGDAAKIIPIQNDNLSFDDCIDACAKNTSCMGMNWWYNDTLNGNPRRCSLFDLTTPTSGSGYTVLSAFKLN